MKTRKPGPSNFKITSHKILRWPPGFETGLLAYLVRNPGCDDGPDPSEGRASSHSGRPDRCRDQLRAEDVDRGEGEGQAAFADEERNLVMN